MGLMMCHSPTTAVHEDINSLLTLILNCVLPKPILITTYPSVPVCLYSLSNIHVPSNLYSCWAKSNSMKQRLQPPEQNHPMYQSHAGFDVPFFIKKCYGSVPKPSDLPCCLHGKMSYNAASWLKWMRCIWVTPLETDLDVKACSHQEQ